jgi:hypothetical protein
MGESNDTKNNKKEEEIEKGEGMNLTHFGQVFEEI